MEERFTTRKVKNANVQAPPLTSLELNASLASYLNISTTQPKDAKAVAKDKNTIQLVTYAQRKANAK